jgi:hypothetical protein
LEDVLEKGGGCSDNEREIVEALPALLDAVGGLVRPTILERGAKIPV